MNLIKTSLPFFTKKSPNTLLETLAQLKKTQAKKIAFVAPNRMSATYSQLYKSVVYARDNFSYAGIQPQEKVVISIQSPPECALVSIALSDGAIAFVLSNSNTILESKADFLNVGITTLITDEVIEAPIVVLAKELGIKVILLSIDKTLPCGSFKMISPINKSNKKWPVKQPSETAFVFQTTGSTAKPKVVPISMKSIMISTKNMSTFLKMNNADRCLNFLPLNFIHGLVTSVFVPLLEGGTIIFAGKFEKNEFYNWFQHYKPTWFSASPAIYSDLLKLPVEKLNSLKNNSLRLLRVGSAAISEQLLMEVEATFNVPLIEAYGMTETLLITCNPINERKIGSVGKIMTSEIRLLNSENQPCKPHETGSILVKGEAITNGYLNNDEANREAFSNGWFSTGDLGYFDEEGFLFLIGRTKEMINKGGQKIAPYEIEQHLESHEAVEQAVVFALPHAVLGEEIAAAIIIKKNKTVSESELKKFMSNLVAPHKIPIKIIQVTEFERTENGKIIRKDLAQKLIPINNNSIVSANENNLLTIEEQLVSDQIAKVLNISAPDLKKDFFTLGGTSLDLVELLTSLNFTLKTEIKAIEFMQAADIKWFAHYLKEKYPNELSNYHSASNSTIQKGDLENSISFQKATLEKSSDEEILKLQRMLVNQWGGERINNNSLVVGRNITGNRKPLFWCFQSNQEFETLANELGPQQPLYAMRSGHMVIKMAEIGTSEMPLQYAKEIIQINPNGPYIIGGNCQGGMVAWHIAQILLKQNKNVELLILMEINRKEHYPNKVGLLFGEDSKTINPYFLEPNPEEAWKKYYGSYTVDIIKGAHGKYFDKENIGILSGKLKILLENCLA